MSDERNEEQEKKTIWNDPDKAKIVSFLVGAAATAAMTLAKLVDLERDHQQGRGQHRKF